MSLKIKQSSTNNSWLEAVKNIEDIITKAEIDELTKRTVSEVKSNTSNKKVAYAWSGGKDSIVLAKICELAGIQDCMLGICNLEYPAFLNWIEENKPKGLTIINTNQNLEWLAKHPQMLFPKDCKTAAHWFHIIQHTAQDRYCKANKLDMILLGRRKADGNYVGKNSNIYTTAKGVCRYSPLSEWTHEQILAFIHYNKLPIPPFYEWKDGYVNGTHPWPARRCKVDEKETWTELYNIDKSIVEAAADYFPIAKEVICR